VCCLRLLSCYSGNVELLGQRLLGKPKIVFGLLHREFADLLFKEKNDIKFPTIKKELIHIFLNE